MKLVYTGDFGVTVISDKTLEAYGAECLRSKDRKWRRSATKRRTVELMNADLAAVQRYFWKRDEDKDQI